jgi:hypothetical protein
MEQVPEKNFGDIFEAPKRANFARRHAAKIVPLKAPLRATAESISVLNTVCRSKAERLITISTLAVAV